MVTHMHVDCVSAFEHACASSGCVFKWVGQGSFLSLSLFSSLNGKRLSAISFCQQLGDAFLQLAAICFNYVY